MIVHLDYETRSRADLKAVGAHRYACDPSTKELMYAVSAEDSEEVFLYVHPDHRTLDMMGENKEAMRLLNSATLVYSHNSNFEQAISWGSSMDIVLTIDKWRCTAAMARKAGLPSSLEQCAAALGLAQQKDPKGKALIKFFCVPDKETGQFNEPKDHPDKWLAFGEYCRQDVRTEKAIHKALKAFELKEGPLQTFLFDLRMNQRGIPVNVPGLRHAQAIIDDVQGRVTKEFVALTGIEPTRREAVRLWLAANGFELPDMQAETISAALERPTFGMATEVLRLYQQISYAAVKKISTMLDWACPDGRMRGVLTYYGAGTGRWSAGGPQIQNAKKPTPEMRPITEQVYAYICSGGSAAGIEAVYGDPLEVLSCCIRHFVHLEGAEMLDGDYNAIEARIICWLAGQTDVLEMMRSGRDMYRFMAAHIYSISEADVNTDQREVGKRVFLGAGFQMGAPKFKQSCLEQYQLDLPIDLCERGIEAYRGLCDKVVRYWYYLNSQAKSAIQAPGKECGPFRMVKLAGLPYLLFKLRSGRSLAYPHPKVEVLPGEEREQITYWGQLFASTQWGRVKLYGGKLAENETQATAADIMAHGAITAEARGMAPFALIHDQALAIRENGRTAEDFAAALADLPPWARGLPIRVEAKVKKFYSK